MSRLIASITCAAMLSSTPVWAISPIAEIVCAPTPQMKDKLTLQFGTTRTAIGMRNPEEVMELWTDDRGDWTMVVTYATGKSCIVAMGQDWMALEPQNPA